MLNQALVGVAMTAQTALSIGVSLTQFNGIEAGTGRCDESTFISPIWNIANNVDYCNIFSDSPVGKYYRVDTFQTTDGDFSCPDGQDIFLKIWQSSPGCGNLADASIGPLSTTGQAGGCIQGPVRSAKLNCGL
jgi:hypothetical protein